MQVAEDSGTAKLYGGEKFSSCDGSMAGRWSCSTIVHLLNLKRQLSNLLFQQHNSFLFQVELFLEPSEHNLPFSEAMENLLVLMSDIK